MAKGKLILICGVSGSGKSTLAEVLMQKEPCAILLSSDTFRATIGTDENDQTVSSTVFFVMRIMTKYLLKKGKTVIIDATNYRVKSRKPFLEEARAVGADTLAYVLDVPLELVKCQNASRARVVPEDVIMRQSDNFVRPTTHEVDRVIIIKNEAGNWKATENDQSIEF